MSSVVDRSGMMEGLDQFEEQAFNLVLGRRPAAFDLTRENRKTVARYGKGFGEQCCGLGGCARPVVASSRFNIPAGTCTSKSSRVWKDAAPNWIEPSPRSSKTYTSAG